MTTSWTLALFLVLSCTGRQAAQQPDPQAEVRTRRLPVSDSLRYVQPGYYVINDSPTWEAFVLSRWDPTLSGATGAPPIDFDRFMVVALEGSSAQICFDDPVIRRGYVLRDTLHLQLGAMEGPCAMAGKWVEAVEVPRQQRPIVLDTSNEWDERKRPMLQRQRFP